jgi:hypothetical protein
MSRAEASDPIVRQGVLRDETARVDYYTTAPSPTQWAAVGVLIRNDASDSKSITRQMIVGTGQDEASAVADLAARFAKNQRDYVRRASTLERARKDAARLDRRAAHPEPDINPDRGAR